MFPGGAAGSALLILRLAVAGMFVESFVATGEPTILSLKMFLTVASVCLLCLGLFTPAVCVVLITVEAATLPQLGDPATPNALLHILVTASFMMLGPGAYSIDAMIFGRRLIQPPGR